MEIGEELSVGVLTRQISTGMMDCIETLGKENDEVKKTREDTSSPGGPGDDEWRRKTTRTCHNHP